MSTMASLVVQISADTAKLVKGFDSAKSTIVGFGKTVLAVAGAGSLMALIRGSIQTVDALGDLAAALNTTIGGLQGLRLAADISGASAEVMDVALAKMLRTIGDAQQGTKIAQDAFSRLGLSFEDLSKLQADQQFARIAEGISRLGTATEQADAAQDIFGRGGVKLMNVLREGSKGVEEMRRRSDELGGSFTKLESVAMDKAADAMGELWQASKNWVAHAVAQFAPAITVVTRAMTDLVSVVGKYATILFKNEFARMAVIWTATAVAISSVVGAIMKLVGALKALTKAGAIMKAMTGPKGWISLAISAVVATAAVWGLSKGLDSVEDEFAAASQQAEAHATALDHVQESAEKAQTELSKLMAHLETSVFQFGLSQTQILLQSEAYTKANVEERAYIELLVRELDALEKKKNAMSGVMSIIESLKDATQKYDEGLLGLYAALQTGVIGLEQYNKAEAMLIAQTIDAPLTERREAFEQLSKTLEEQVATWGMTRDELDLYKISLMNLIPAERDYLNTLVAQRQELDKLAAAKKDAEKLNMALADAARGVWDDTRTPMERYEAELDRLSILLNEGKLDWDTYGRAVRKAHNEMRGNARFDADNPAILKGTTEAFTLEMKSLRPKEEKLSEEQLKEIKKSNEHLRAIRNQGGTDLAVADFG